MKLFSVFNLLAAALLILAVGMIVVPDAASRARLANEVRVVKVLRLLAAIQNEYRRDSGPAPAEPGRYGFLAELLEHDRGRSLPFRATGPDGSVCYSGYRIRAFLPDGSGRPVAREPGARVDSALAARTFLLLAEPLEPGRTGSRSYAVRHEHTLAQCDMPSPASRADTPEVPLPLLARRDERSGRILLPDHWPSPWRPFLTEVHAVEMKKLFDARGLPLPENLARLFEPR